MYLKSITIQGFKSFAKKVNLDLTSPVTGVVGPNGSGKSNVAEAIRFVLGEQSMKGLRSKSGSDLIFKGSPKLSPLSRASVSLNLDNTQKQINQKLLTVNQEINSVLNNFLNLEEIIITREIYSDGASEYLINGTKVRLKDVQELLALANISASGHTIVNQGEADRILLSNNIERREMIEDALGLRIYHMRIKEGEKKLDKVSNHLKEIELHRRENLPQLNYLRKQVKELEKREEEIELTSQMLKIYLARLDEEIKKEKNDLNNFQVEDLINTEEEKLHTLLRAKQNLNENQNPNTNLKNQEILDLENQIQDFKTKLNDLITDKENIYKDKVKLELEINFLTKKVDSSKLTIPTKVEIQKYFIEKSILTNYHENRNLLWETILTANQAKDYLSLTKHLEKANLEEKDFLKLIKASDKENALEINQEIEKENIDYTKDIQNLESKLKEKDEQLKSYEEEISQIKNDLNTRENKLNSLSLQAKESSYKLDNEILQIKLTLEQYYAKRNEIKVKQEHVISLEDNFNTLLQEMSVLIGQRALNYKSFKLIEATEEEKVYLESTQVDLRKKLERSKIRIEESGILNAGEVLDEYQSLNERDEFLSKEILDLEQSRNNLESLITDLKNTLLLDFNTGLTQINTNFNNYFGEVFPGGKAELIFEKILKKNSDDESELENEHAGEPGVEISINLPQKKVKDLQMLSGGERALSSIALIFAMSSINHPPFMVLDETDAALDEANARKYGKMIKRLSENSKLLVITHNRETMNQCDVLYGVTVGQEGCSKLLSIKFAEASEYAK